MNVVEPAYSYWSSPSFSLGSTDLSPLLYLYSRLNYITIQDYYSLPRMDFFYRFTRKLEGILDASCQ